VSEYAAVKEMSMLNRIVVYTFSVVSFLGATVVHGNGFMDLLVASGYEENLPRGYLDKDIQGSRFLGASLSAGKLYQPLANTSIVLSGSAGYSSYLEQHGFDYGSLEIATSLQQKFGMGAYTPRITLGVGAGREESEGLQRDRNLFRYSLGISQRLNQALEISAGFSREISRGTDEPAIDFSELPYLPGITRPVDPMDYRNRTLSGSLSYTLRNGWLWSAGYRYLHGHIVSSAVPPVKELFIHAKAVALDPAYDQERLMYLMNADADMWSTSLSIPWGDDTALDFAYQWQNFDVDDVGSYKNSQFSITLVHQI